MKEYKDLLESIITQGNKRGDRTGTGTISTFGEQIIYDLREGFPLLTIKDMRENFPKIFHELMWFIKGETNIRYLVDRNVNIWNGDAYRWFMERHGKHFPQMTKKHFIELIKHDDAFAKEYGDLGRIYGKQWTDFGGGEGREGVNQLYWVINELKHNPESRRLIINGWNLYDILKGKVALPSCHVMLQLYVDGDYLDGKLTQRSGDAFLGVPYNMASYSMLLHMIAHLCGLKPRKLYHSFGDLHLYNNHVEQALELIKREPLKLPRLHIKHRNGIKELEDFRFEDFELVGYSSHGTVTAQLNV